MELERLGVAARVVELVGDQDHRLARAAQEVGELLVAGSDAGARVDHEQHEIGLGDRRARLVGDLALHRARVARIDAAGVEDREGRAPPLDDQLLAVARDAGLLVHDGLARRGQAVDERRLADVREADDGDRAEQGAVAALVPRRGCCSRARRSPRAYHVAPSRDGRPRTSRPAGRDRRLREALQPLELRVEPRGRLAHATDGPSKRSCSPNANVTGCHGSRTSRCVPCTTAGTTGAPSASAIIIVPGFTSPISSVRLPRALDEHAEQAALAQHVARRANGGEVALAAPHAEDAAVLEERLEHGARLEELGLRHPADRPVEHRAVQDRVPRRHVVRREHDGARRRHVLGAVGADPEASARTAAPNVRLNAIQVRSGVQKPNSSRWAATRSLSMRRAPAPARRCARPPRRRSARSSRR